MRKAGILSAGMAAAAMFTMSAFQARSATSTEANRAFIKSAIQGDLAEMQIGKLAEQKGTDKSIRQFGKKLATDHSANLKKAESVARSMGVKAPKAPGANQQATYGSLSQLPGSRFDRQFAEAMVKDHRKDIKEFQNQAQKPGPTAAFASQTLPTLKQHLAIAESLDRSMTGSVRPKASAY